MKLNTVNDLINYLSKIEDKEQPIAYQYYLLEHTDGNEDLLQATHDVLGSVYYPNEAKDYINEYA